MPNVSLLRQIVAALRGLVFKAKDAGSPALTDVLTMAAGVVQDIASAEGKVPARRPAEGVRKLGGE